MNNIQPDLLDFQLFCRRAGTFLVHVVLDFCFVCGLSYNMIKGFFTIKEGRGLLERQILSLYNCEVEEDKLEGQPANIEYLSAQLNKSIGRCKQDNAHNISR